MIVTQNDIIKMNKAYKEFGTYAAASRATGFSPSTVKKYVIKDFVEVDQDKIVRFKGELPEFKTNIFWIKDWGSLCELTDKELDDLKVIWEEMEI